MELAVFIREHIASNLGINVDEFGYAPFNQRGGLGKVHQRFGAELPKVIDELNRWMPRRTDPFEHWSDSRCVGRSMGRTSKGL